MRSSALTRFALLSLGSLLTLTAKVSAQELDIPGVSPAAVNPSDAPAAASPAAESPAASSPAAAADAPKERRHRRREENANASASEAASKSTAESAAPEEPHQARPFATSSHTPRVHHNVHVGKVKAKKVAAQSARDAASVHKKKHAGKKKHHKKKRHHKGQ